ncbi:MULTISPECIES: reverse transcriptase domain-containing protein [Stutzerimonas stutzeri group]|uniref:reverse transcriptase domain-containing protein n=1 Tax=Stutzerimonas stutzeri group TaxID=136846 RepID=UPI00210B4DED|nr:MULTISPECIES: reverse transcriptase domain-containing protein [Stutzerimonas stutzeri group]MCQ4327585.1 reverse transcriptase/maturase family protein [Stutzerimonas stutzeri]
MFSSSDEIKREAEEFESRLPDALKDIQRALSKQEFKFLLQTGVAQKKPGGKSRPLVLAPIPNRIVQRAILDVLQRRVRFVKRVLATPTSYGGIPEKRVSMAISHAREAMRAGARFHVRSDIPAFFTKINKDRVLELLRPHLRCEATLKLFDEAIKTDLANIDELRRKGLDAIFPIGIEGVAQGSPLSPLVANIYLADFDLAMNTNGITCLRYIDDFLLLAPNLSDVDKAFNRALKELGKIGLAAYDPRKDKSKASRGSIQAGFDFLGCNVSLGLIQPSEATRKRFRAKLEAEFATASRALRYNAQYQDGDGRYSYSSALYQIDKIILGWGKAFTFCNGTQCMDALDKFISKKLAHLEEEKIAVLAKSDSAARRRILGVRLLADIQG